MEKTKRNYNAEFFIFFLILIVMFLPLEGELIRSINSDYYIVRLTPAFFDNNSELRWAISISFALMLSWCASRGFKREGYIVRMAILIVPFLILSQKLIAYDLGYLLDFSVTKEYLRMSHVERLKLEGPHFENSKYGNRYRVYVNDSATRKNFGTVGVNGPVYALLSQAEEGGMGHRNASYCIDVPTTQTRFGKFAIVQNGLLPLSQITKC